jgi:amino acid transporter
MAADSGLAGGRGSKLGRRLPAVLGIFLGGLAGALLVESGSAPLVLVIAPLLMVAVAVAAAWLSRAEPKWVRESG